MIEPSPQGENAANSLEDIAPTPPQPVAANNRTAGEHPKGNTWTDKIRSLVSEVGGWCGIFIAVAWSITWFQEKPIKADASADVTESRLSIAGELSPTRSFVAGERRYQIHKLSLTLTNDGHAPVSIDRIVVRVFQGNLNEIVSLDESGDFGFLDLTTGGGWRQVSLPSIDVDPVLLRDQAIIVPVYLAEAVVAAPSEQVATTGECLYRVVAQVYCGQSTTPYDLEWSGFTDYAVCYPAYNTDPAAAPAEAAPPAPSPDDLSL